MAKELNKLTVEQLDLTLVKKIAPGKDEKLRSIKRLEQYLNSLGADGHKLTAPLVGINELRQGDAHLPSADVKDSLQLFGITDNGDLIQMAQKMIYQVAWSIGMAGDLIVEAHQR